ncbi:hypothetical protein FRX31_009303 [Thalictrum thalictroides]|uniref:RNase H type-1 domain-containing protein n=1 Tax=Thalictrum thalictroides TaxID=46969 RepID=A0A7J6WWR6_THATH|nr:hypothetical protein FRX31_009303 [Thalictrum thalictroides]
MLLIDEWIGYDDDIEKIWSDQFESRKSTPNYSTSPRNFEIQVAWKRPPVGWLKLNTDGASIGNLGVAGFGCIVRDHDGRCLLALSCPIPFASNNVAEFSAVLFGLKILTMITTENFIIETDSQLVQKALMEDVLT